MSTGCLYKWDGALFTKVLDGDVDLGGFGKINGIWGLDDNNIWAVGDDIILFWDGVAWAKQVNPVAGVEYKSVWGRSTTDVYAVGMDAGVTTRYLIHWDGIIWSVLYSVADAQNFYAVHGT